MSQTEKRLILRAIIAQSILNRVKPPKTALEQVRKLNKPRHINAVNRV